MTDYKYICKRPCVWLNPDGLCSRNPCPFGQVYAVQRGDFISLPLQESIQRQEPAPIKKKHYCRAVIRTDSNGIESRYPSIKEAASQAASTSQAIYNAVKFHTKTTSGYKWRYDDA